MERAERAEQLAKARAAVAEGDASLEHQRELIARLKREGRDITEAQVVLDALIKRQAQRHAMLGHIIRQFPPD